MEKKIEKVLRFIELSKKFSKSENEVVPQTDEEKSFGMHLIAGCSIGSTVSYDISNMKTFTINNAFHLEGRDLYIDESGNVKAKDNKPVTRADKLKAIAEAKSKTLSEYTEYINLQYHLQEYFTALKKINE